MGTKQQQKRQSDKERVTKFKVRDHMAHRCGRSMQGKGQGQRQWRERTRPGTTKNTRKGRPSFGRKKKVGKKRGRERTALYVSGGMEPDLSAGFRLLCNDDSMGEGEQATMQGDKRNDAPCRMDRWHSSVCLLFLSLRSIPTMPTWVKRG